MTKLTESAVEILSAEEHILGLEDGKRSYINEVTALSQAVALFQSIRENASIDWTLKENVRAKLKVVVRRLLRKYGYPPDMQLLATETVMRQAEMLAGELTRGDGNGYQGARRDVLTEV